MTLPAWMKIPFAVLALLALFFIHNSAFGLAVVMLAVALPGLAVAGRPVDASPGDLLRWDIGMD